MKSATIIATVSAIVAVSATQPQRKRTNNKRRQINNVVPAKVETEKYDPFLGLPSVAEETQQYNERKLQETAEMSLPLDLSDGTDAPVATPVVTTDAPVAAPGVDTPVPTSWYPTYIPTAGSNDFAAAQGGVENGSSSIISSVGVTLLLGGVGVWMNMN